jgi:Spy/CpxP family protein refolding chaperone
MFIKPSILIILAVLLLLIAIFMTRCSSHRFHSQSPEKKAEWVVQKISNELDLDDNQKTKLDEIKSEVLAKHRNFSGVKSELWDEVYNQVHSEKIDEEKLNTLFAKKEAQFQDMRVFSVGKFAEFHAMLTPEQRDKLAEKMTKFKERCRH